jgi:hypothetical protein
MEIIAVVDFETTGMSPRLGARATEIAVVLVQGARIVGRYQSLMRSGASVPPFIERLTGISNRMLDGAPPASQVMREAAAFVGANPMVAHNAAFDRICRTRVQRTACSPCCSERRRRRSQNAWRSIGKRIRLERVLPLRCNSAADFCRPERGTIRQGPSLALGPTDRVPRFAFRSVSPPSRNLLRPRLPGPAIALMRRRPRRS